MTSDADGRRYQEAINPRLLGVLCILLAAGLLGVGLWPFHSPWNQVTWRADGRGVRFGDHGTILSPSYLHAPHAQEGGPCSLELWVEPQLNSSSSAIVAFYQPDRSRQFSLRQSLSDLELHVEYHEPWRRTRITRLYVSDILRARKTTFLTITANGERTSVYVDGAPLRLDRGFRLSSQDLEGTLIIAASPSSNDSWSGDMLGLALYDRQLNASEVLRHYQTWNDKGRPETAAGEGMVALYLFNEGAGRAIHNQITSGADLYVPDRYMLVNAAFLEPFWDAFDNERGYWEDVLENIGGFVPFGFLVYAYLSLSGRIRRVALVAILLGFAISLTIETLQVFLPTRDSDTTDLITDTLGTCLGAGLYRLNFCRLLFARIWTLFFQRLVVWRPPV